MSQTAIQTKPDDFNPTDPGPGDTSRREPRTAWEWVKLILKPIASLRVTVVLFALSMFLVFCGTLAQVEMGLWTAMDEYFRSAFVWIPFQLFVKFAQIFFRLDPSLEVGGSFPFPGGWLLGGLLLANLLAAHLVRFRISWRRSGILLIHAGLVIMMLSELFTGLYAVESRMTIAEGETVNFVEVSRKVELALTDTSNDEYDEVVVVPESKLRNPGIVQSDALPVDVEILSYHDNSSLVESHLEPKEPGPVFSSAAGGHFKLLPRAEESGAASEKADYPAIKVRFLERGTGKSLGEYTLSVWFSKNATNRIPFYQFAPQQLQVGKKTYVVELRPKRIYKPYHIHLIKFTHKKYIGTDKPMDYNSLVRLSDSDMSDARELRISMNDPLRHQGETFYQAGFLPGDKGTVLQVVRNPSWLLPYVSCVVVGLGMIVHFGLHLLEYLRRRAA